MTAAKKPARKGRKPAAKKRAPRTAASAPNKARHDAVQASDQAAKPEVDKIDAEQAAEMLERSGRVFHEPERNKGGRPTKYRAEFASQARKLCDGGFTDEQLADFFDVHVSTIYRWMAEHKKFCEAVKVAKEIADQRVERSLYQRALGYTTPAVKIFMPAGAKEPVYATYRENVQPSDTAIIFWLKNRKKDTWRDRQDHEHSGPDGGAIEIDETEAARRVAFMIGRAAGKVAAQNAQETNEPADSE